MTLQVDPPDLDRHVEDEIPVVVCIALDHGKRRRLAALLDGVGVLVFTPDVVTAHSMLGRQLMLATDDSASDSADRVVRVGGLEVDRTRRRATWQDTPLLLTQLERELLACLAAGPDRVWTYRELYAAAWTGRYLDPGPVHAAIKRLRRKLRQAGVPVRIEAVRGIGYELVESDPDR